MSDVISTQSFDLNGNPITDSFNYANQTTVLSNAFNFASLSNAFSQYVVSPLNAFGLGGFIFDIEGEADTRLDSDITDHYVEDNSAVQDHIALKPIRVTLRNYVGELVDRRDNTTNTALQQVTQKLTVLNSYLPVLTPGAQQAYDIISGNQSLPSPDVLSALSPDNIAQSVSSAADLYGMAQNLLPPTTRQQQAYEFFSALRTAKILTAVQTPHAFLTNMVIESIMAIQNPDTKDMSDFTITLKQIRFASTQFTPYISQQGATAAQSQSPQINSNVQGAPQPLNPSPSVLYNDLP